MRGITFDKGQGLLTNFPCSQCQFYLTEQDIGRENYSFWFSDYSNEIVKEGSFYGANFWLKGVDHLECPETETCEDCDERFLKEKMKELQEGDYYCEPCYQQIKDHHE